MVHMVTKDHIHRDKYFYVIESSVVGRRASLRSQQRNEDLYLTTASPMNFVEPGLFAQYVISVV